MKFNGIYLFFLIIMFSCTNSPKNARQSTGKWINVERSFYSINYRDNWQFVEDGRKNTTFLLYTDYEDENDKFRENINLIITEADATSDDLDKFVRISENPDPQKIANYNIFSSERIEGDPFDKHIMVFSAEERGFKYKHKQHYWVVNDSIYVLSFDSKPEKYDKYIQEADSIMSTFTLKFE